MERFIVDITILVVTAKVLEEVLGRVGVPSVICYISAGFILGPSILGLVYYGEELRIVGNLALFFLVLYAGLEVPYSEFLRSSLKATFTSIISFSLTFISAFSVGYILGLEFHESIVVGLVLSVTALPVAAAILSELGIVDSRVGVLVISVAMATDVIVIILLGLLIGLLAPGSSSLNSPLQVLAGVTVLVLTLILAYNMLLKLTTRRPDWILSLAPLVRSQETGLAILLISALLFGVLSEILGLHFIVGVFLTGLLVDKSWLGEKAYRKLVESIKGITLSLLLPLFASIIGLIASTTGFLHILNLDTLKLTLTFTIIAVVVRYVAGYVGARAIGLTHVESKLVGVGLTLKGAMDKIVLLVTYQLGLITSQLLIPLMTSLVIATALAPTMLKTMLSTVAEEMITMTSRTTSKTTT